VALVGNQQPAEAIEMFNRFLSEHPKDARRADANFRNLRMPWML